MPTYQELIDRLKQAKTVAERAKIKEEIRALKTLQTPIPTTRKKWNYCHDYPWRFNGCA